MWCRWSWYRWCRGCMCCRYIYIWCRWCKEMYEMQCCMQCRWSWCRSSSWLRIIFRALIPALPLTFHGFLLKATDLESDQYQKYSKILCFLLEFKNSRIYFYIFYRFYSFNPCIFQANVPTSLLQLGCILSPLGPCLKCCPGGKDVPTQWFFKAIRTSLFIYGPK